MLHDIIPNQLYENIVFYAGEETAHTLQCQPVIDYFNKLRSFIIRNYCVGEDHVKVSNRYIGIDEIALGNDLNINMMPFLRFNKNSLPIELHKYWTFIESCNSSISTRHENEYAYLTVRESFIDKGKTQSRPGLHIEAPRIEIDGKLHFGSYNWGGGFNGGIFIYSNLSNTFRMWKCLIKDEGNNKGGNVEHLRPVLEDPESNIANVIYFISDHTPHEALPQLESARRLFIRLVVGKVDIWYSQHSTPNPLCSLPEGVKIVTDNKF